MALETAGFIVSAVGLTLSVAQTVLGTLQCEQLKDLFGADLDGLEGSVKTILAVLSDAESKQARGIELSAQERNFIDQIKDVVYDADDVIDAYLTRAKRQQIDMESGHNLSTKVRGLYSRFKNLAIASPKVKKIAKKLDKIGKDAQNFKLHFEPNSIIRKETYSTVENDIVGREDDQRRIVDMLLQPIAQGKLPVLTIVGVGGLGKTTLAKLVYNDPRIQNEFSLGLWWVCVSDQERNSFFLKAILAKIYLSATREKSIGDMGLDLLIKELKSKLDQNKYLLVLDDLWNENKKECDELVNILSGSVEKGSRIVVTTRSKKTAKAIGSSQTYELHGLSDENSWDLFEKRVGREIKEGHHLFEIGKDIVKKCVNVPLAINVIGSLLYGADENEWISFEQSKLFDIKKDDNDIINILKFSYHQLSASLKSCFTYCAIFPKDFEIQKGRLTSMWMAHDYVKNEDEAEYHFKILGQRSFFQDMKENDDGEFSFKIHDLMHDMAQEVAGKEIYIANSTTTKLDKKIHHLNDGACGTRTNAFVTPAKIRSYVKSFSESNDIPIFPFPVSAVLAKWRHLRVLDLHNLDIIELPKEIGDLLHLRYLDLSENWQLRMLPEALTKLINLQFLNLYGCWALKELPKDFKKLVYLRTLYVPDELEYMPLGMASMTSLSRLNRFIVGHRKEDDMLESLRGLRNLRGSLVIDIKRDYKDAKVHSGKGGGYICSTQHLHSIGMKWHHERNEEVRVGNDEDVLEALQPHRNLKELNIVYYSSVRIPRWAREDSLTTSLPNLVNIQLWYCDGLEELPWLGRLQHLKTLYLWELKNVEYMENRRCISRDDGGVEASSKSSTSVESSTTLFFPSLEELVLNLMLKLKGWWMGEDEIVNPPAAHILLSFPRLSELRIINCPNLTSFPLCPNLSVEQLRLKGINKRLEGKIRKEQGEGTRRRRRRFRRKIRKEIAEKVPGEQGEGTRKENMVTEIVERVVAGEGSSNIFQN